MNRVPVGGCACACACVDRAEGARERCSPPSASRTTVTFGSRINNTTAKMYVATAMMVNARAARNWFVLDASPSSVDE